MKRFALLMIVALAVGCGKSEPEPGTPAGGDEGTVATTNPTPGDLPVFTLATSEYPSWSTYVVAGKVGLVNPEEGGEYSDLEKKYGVDIVIEATDYDSCFSLYGSGTVDAACLTNMDSLNPSLGRATTAFMPTSTSAGGDKAVVVGVEDLEALKSVPIHGLELSVSQYTVVRGLEEQGQNPDDFKFINLPPDAAATAIQTGSNDVKAICVWNPYAIITLKAVPEAKAIFTSDLIAGEIIDQVIIGNESLAKEGGENFAKALCDIQYQINDKLWNSDQKVKDAARNALKQSFAPTFVDQLDLADMEKVLSDTRFFKTAKDGIEWYKSDEFKTKMQTVVKTCQTIGVVEGGKLPTIGYEDDSAQLNFTTRYMEAVAK